MTAPTISEALKGFQTAQVIDTKALGVALSGMTGMQRPPAFKFMKSLDGPILHAEDRRGAPCQSRSTFRVLDAPSVFSASVNEALKGLARVPKIELGRRSDRRTGGRRHRRVARCARAD